MSWKIIQGTLKCISVSSDGNLVWGVNSNNEIFMRQGFDWVKIEGHLKQISVGSFNHVWGVDADDNIFVRHGYNWVHIPGHLKQISVSDLNHVWGIDANDNIFMGQIA